MKKAADRHRLAAYGNKYCWQAFRSHQYWWPWTTMKSRKWVFSDFLQLPAVTHISTVNCTILKLPEIDQDNLHINFF